MSQEYVEQRNGGYYVQGTRVSLDSVVYGFRGGASPEKIAETFPSLTLAQVYGAIAFYIENRGDIDAYLEQGEKAFEESAPPLSKTNLQLHEKLERARRQITSKH